MIKIIEAEVMEGLKQIPTRSVNCIVTSPPYFQVRDYGHDDQIGLEKTPAEFIDKLVKVFREARRTLRNDGTLWLNIGDSYSRKGGRKGHNGRYFFNEKATHLDSMHAYRHSKDLSLRPKNLIGIPWRLAFALQDDGWYLRSDIIWRKKNPMPESALDRPTKGHEYFFLLSKTARYYYDYEAIAEPMTQEEIAKTFRGGSYNRDATFDNSAGGDRKVSGNQKIKSPSGWDTAPGSHGSYHREGRESGVYNTPTKGRLWEKGLRHKRTVWDIATEPTDDDHYATFPQLLVEPAIVLRLCEGKGLEALNFKI